MVPYPLLNARCVTIISVSRFGVDVLKVKSLVAFHEELLTE